MGRTLKTLKDILAKQRHKESVIIDNWEHFKDWYKKNGPSETHEIIFHGSVAFIQTIDKKRVKGPHYYLSTHTFYGKRQWIRSTEVLRECGFKVIIRNWDAEEEGQDWPKKTYVGDKNNA